MAVSLDGKIASHSLETDRKRLANGFSSQADRELVRDSLFHADIVVIGANTLRASGRFWLIENYRHRLPVWVVFTRQPESLDSFLRAQPEAKVIVVTESPSSLPNFSANVEVLSHHGQLPANFVLESLKDRKYSGNIVLFGGSAINSLFYREGLVDELKVTVSPVIVGQVTAPSLVVPNLPNIIRLCLKSSQIVGDHVFLNYAVQQD